MAAWSHRAGLAICLTAAVMAVACAAAPIASAAVEVPFATQFSTSGRGDIALAANTLMTCPDGGGVEAKCLGARNGEAATAADLNNNNYEMERVDVDADPGTFDSSGAILSLPAGAVVQFAGLYYGARTTKGESSPSGEAAPDPAARGTVLLRAPGALTYSSLTAAVHDSVSISGAYTGFVDVTSLVAAAGAGEYAVANVQAGTGKDRYAGWSLVVAYSDSAAPPRSIRIFEGLASIQAADPPLQIPITDLETPPSGTVSASVGVVAYEGDRGASGDKLRLDGRDLADAANPPNNVFNSAIAVRGVNVTTKTPNYVNQFGFDANVLGADGFLGNDATAAMLEEATSLEQYLTQVVAVAIQLDPRALEPPAPPPPASGTSESPKPEPQPKPHRKPKHHEPPPPEIALRIDSGDATVRPTEVIGFSITVDASGQAVRGLEVCNALPAPLRRLRAPAASVHGQRACWSLAKLPKGKSRTFRTTAMVTASARRTLVATTVVRAKNARTRRTITRIRVAPLPTTPCARPARTSGGPVAHASC